MNDRARELAERIAEHRKLNGSKWITLSVDEVEAALRTTEQRGYDAGLALASEHGHTFLNGEMKEQCICGFILGEALTFKEIQERQRKHIRSFIGSPPAPDTDREKRLVAWVLREAKCFPYDMDNAVMETLAAFNEAEAKSNGGQK